jgi:hypothetical protein
MTFVDNLVLLVLVVYFCATFYLLGLERGRRK